MKQKIIIAAALLSAAVLSSASVGAMETTESITPSTTKNEMLTMQEKNEKMRAYKKAHTISGTTQTGGEQKEGKYRFDTGSHSSTGEMVRSSTGNIMKDHRSNVKSNIKKYSEKMEMRERIIDKLLAGESLSEIEKSEAKIFLSERKERRERVKNAVTEAKKMGDGKMTAQEKSKIRSDERKEIREEKKTLSINK